MAANSPPIFILLLEFVGKLCRHTHSFIVNNNKNYDDSNMEYGQQFAIVAAAAAAYSYLLQFLFRPNTTKLKINTTGNCFYFHEMIKNLKSCKNTNHLFIFCLFYFVHFNRIANGFMTLFVFVQ